MCTSFIYRTSAGSFFGRSLDLDSGFNEKVVITPRGYFFPLKNGQKLHTNHAMIGMAALAGSYPLYAEAANDAGLAMAGLNFPGNAVYHPAAADKENITPFELIPWILGQAGTVDEAEVLLRKVNLLNIPFAPQMPLAPLHFMIADSSRTLVAEPAEEGLLLYNDSFQVMTNNPPFPYHEWNICNYRHMSASDTAADFAAGQFALSAYAAGMGSIGLPGDPSSASRFVRAAFALANSPRNADTETAVAQTFHILENVAMVDGSVVCQGGGHDITRYVCCIDLQSGTYFYRTYYNSRTVAVSMRENLRNTAALTVYELRTEQDILQEN